MAVVAILSHGENGSIICTNGEKVLIEDILSKFNNREAPPLKGKPKFFIFQSCRGLKIGDIPLPSGRHLPLRPRSGQRRSG